MSLSRCPGSSGSYDGDTPLHWAAEKGHPEMAVLLLNYGADLEARNTRGRTPLHPRHAPPRVIEYYRRTYGHGETFLHTALAALGRPGCQCGTTVPDLELVD